MGNKQRKAVPDVTVTRIEESAVRTEAVLSLPADLVVAPAEQLHKIDPALHVSSFSKLAEWKKINAAAPFPACYDAVLFADQSTLFVLAGSTEKGSKKVHQYFGYNLEQKNWYVIDLDEPLPAITLGLRVASQLYLFAAHKNTMFIYDTESHLLLTRALPFDYARKLLSVHHVRGEIYLLHGESDTSDFSTTAVYSIDTQSWEMRSCGATKPPERSGFATAVIDECIYLYGGFRQPGYVSDLWCLDTRHMQWRSIDTTGTRVGCAGHSLSALHVNGQHHLVAFGGYNGHYLNSAQFLNLHTLEWQVFTCQPVNAEATIGPRTGASALVLHNNLYVVGGYNGPYHNDVYVLKPRALSLKLLCFEYLHRHAKNMPALHDKLPADLYEEYRTFV